MFSHFKRSTLFFLVLILGVVGIFSGCTDAPHEMSPAVAETPSTEPEPEKADVADLVLPYISENFPDVQVDRISNNNGALEIKIASDLSDETVPDNWEETRDLVIQLCQGVKDNISSDDVKNVVVYLKSASGNNALTALNGKVSYDAYAEYNPGNGGGNPPTMSLAEFRAISTGMTYQQVTDIVGSSGEVISEVEIAGMLTQMRQWKGEGSIGANANVTFQDGKVVSKAQAGLE